MLKLTANRDTLIHKGPNKQNLPEPWRLDNSISPMILLWMETALLLCAENSQGKAILLIPSRSAH